MPREKGTTKTGGRKAGTPNRQTSEIRETLRGLFGELIESLGDVNELASRDKVTLLSKILPYVISPIKEDAPDSKLTINLVRED